MSKVDAENPFQDLNRLGFDVVGTVKTQVSICTVH